jgi:hypothetical protein
MDDQQLGEGEKERVARGEYGRRALHRCGNSTMKCTKGCKSSG